MSSEGPARGPNDASRKRPDPEVKLLDEIYRGYFRIRRFEVDGRIRAVMSGPGHDVAMVVGVGHDPDGAPRCVIKLGDTRPARVLRGRPYVRSGLVAGRLDAAGVSPAEIAAKEVEEEIGGRALGTPAPLGPHPVPSMPIASTEADLFFMVPVAFEPGERPQGDGMGMEVPEILGHAVVAPQVALHMIRNGDLGEACRARVVYGRAFEKLGWMSPLRDQEPGAPGSPTLGLGPIQALTGHPPLQPETGLREQTGLDGAEVDIQREVAMPSPRGRHLVCRAKHLQGDAAFGAPYPVEILDLPFDEAEIIPYAQTDEGLKVRLFLHVEPALAAKATLTDELLGSPTPVRLWQGKTLAVPPGSPDEAVAAWSERGGYGAPQLLMRSEASPGQSTLVEHLYAAEARIEGAGWFTMADAIRIVREEGASARTEAGLLELALQNLEPSGSRI